jgi:hypothetical protein
MTEKVSGIADEPPSRKGLWDSIYKEGTYGRQVYADDTTVKKGVHFLTHPEIRLVEDWGCGYGGVKNYLPVGVSYRGVDGSHSRFADIIADLESYRSSVDAIFLRHVLEHNPRWKKVLENALASFRKRMVLILFTPWQTQTRVIREYPNWEGTGVSMWDIGFKREDILAHFGDLRWGSEQELETNTGYGVEHIFYLER